MQPTRIPHERTYRGLCFTRFELPTIGALVTVQSQYPTRTGWAR